MDTGSNPVYSTNGNAIILKERLQTQVTGLHGKGYHGIGYGAVRFESFFNHTKEVTTLFKTENDGY